MVLRILEEIAEGCEITNKSPNKALEIFFGEKYQYISQLPPPKGSGL